jgi:YD repeat-containing protein
LLRRNACHSGTTTYTYSSDGNRTATTPASGPASSYTWDQANDMTGADVSGTSTSFVYDGSGLRQSETSGASTTYFCGAGDTRVEQISSGGTPPT